MNLEPLTKSFARIGARLIVSHDARRLRQPPVIVGDTLLTGRQPFRLDIARDHRGEYFDLVLDRRAEPDLRVLQANQAARHLLLHSAGPDGGERFLCGHDERHWFVAGIADRVTTVTEAKRSLLPPAMRDLGLSATALAQRRGPVFKRQGEWFFVPSDRDLRGCPILHGEPLVRGRQGKSHVVAELVRFGGTPVILCGRQEYTLDAWADAIRQNPALAQGRHQRLMKDPEVYVRGAVRHADHATLVLEDWHRVYMNAERFSTNVAFYD